MATSFGALCNDFYINQKLSLKLDLPADRETLLHLFDRVRKSVPSMDRLRRYQAELVMESSRKEPEYRWLALRRNNIRTGHVNPQSMEEGFSLHKLLLELAPYNLTVSPLDVDYLELLFGFDLECTANHDEVVYDALFAHSPVAPLMQVKGARTIDVQPVFGMSLGEKGDTQCTFEVRTRPKTRRGKAGRFRDDPISIFLTMRKYGPIHDIAELPQMLTQLGDKAQQLAAEQLIPHLLTPIARQITSSSA